jgi:pimeloyl-ACP methyl ester carboxylesterase
MRSLQGWRYPAVLWLVVPAVLLAACAAPTATPSPVVPTSGETGTPAGAPSPIPTRAPTRTPLPASTPSATPSAAAPSPTTTPAGGPEAGGLAVLFPAADGVRISGTFYVPTGTAPYKTVILVHALGADRRQWDTFVPVLQGAGYAVLAYDMRGAGQSEDAPANDAFLDTLPLDVGGALVWLATRPEVDPAHIGVIGAALGANVAYVANGSQAAVRTAVLLSPANTGAVLLGADLPGFTSRNVLFVCDEAGQPDAQALYDQTRAPRQLVVVPGVRAVGVGLLEAPDVVQQILDWLSAQL